MNEETFNLGIRKFLKMVGVNSQREFEQAVAKAIAEGRITGTETLAARQGADALTADELDRAAEILAVAIAPRVSPVIEEWQRMRATEADAAKRVKS